MIHHWLVSKLFGLSTFVTHKILVIFYLTGLISLPVGSYPFDGHNVLKRTKILTSEKPTILHGGTSDTFKTGTKIRYLNSHSDISVYLGECSHLQPL